MKKTIRKNDLIKVIDCYEEVRLVKGSNVYVCHVAEPYDIKDVKEVMTPNLNSGYDLIYKDNKVICNPSLRGFTFFDYNVKNIKDALKIALEVIKGTDEQTEVEMQEIIENIEYDEKSRGKFE